ncbi:CRISPR-associated helicase/endonuclease Cas3 [Thiolapillus brandeum]|uniref:CRISPR-associated helicase Cas3 n=1 Tax=Thiolapillus brandeum TaxID=1076588 RepID=A0A7U6GIV0_9GAMM|nr:CRISPR-associated helicase/endonuclease Cas3 [Thiolapillus brandeum]BAO44426.1 CRISPR-associated helicase Cas3 [Thiolapillus brandeum]
MKEHRTNPNFFRYWGKAGSREAGEAGFHLLAYHSLDVAAVAAVLFEQRPELLRRLSRLMGLPEDQTRVWVLFLLGLHDLGKFAESFQQLREDLRLALWPDEKTRNKNYSLRHDALGWLLWREFLCFELFDEAFQDFIEDAMDYWMAAVTGHHGWPPDMPGKSERLKRHFREFDQQAALDFSRQWLELIGPDLDALKQHFDDAEFVHRQREASWLLAGIAVLADWLGSNREYFAFIDTPTPLRDYWERHALPAAVNAVRHAGILPPPVRILRDPGDLFDYLKQPTPLQQACLELPIEPEPQLFILEDVTGAGKTEAALILAARLMAAGQGEGLYIGLPTMATANAMYERMAGVYRRLYESDDQPPSLILSHGARHLSEAFRQSLLALQVDDPRYGREEESIVAQCNRWLADNRKKALLADVGIGTIDQALLAVMPARHQSLRLLGLENKILILDEVHAYDAYTSEPLKRLISFHAALGGSVILLSATLTKKQRGQLIVAFQANNSIEPEAMAYPLLTHASREALLAEQPVHTRASVARQVQIRLYHEEAAILEEIRAAVQAGECICWIRNTVADARSAWQALRNAEWLKKESLHLFHSRFALCDRLRIEQAMLNRFGKDSTDNERRGQVLIATQVVEQSLDLDFDRMISDVAPIDLLIQRAGRLHRHARGKCGQPVLDLLTPEPIDVPQPDWYKAFFPKAHYVYPDTLILWRTARLLQEKGGWRMPEDARDLLEFVYNEVGDIPPGLADASLAVEGETLSQRDAGRFASLRLESGYRGGPLWDEDARIATRLGDESQTLYLARWENGKLQPWADEGPYRWDRSSLRIRAGQLRELAPIEDAALRAALDTLREQEKRFDDESFIVPLRPTNEGGITKARDKIGSALNLCYTADAGLEIQRDGDAPPP